MAKNQTVRVRPTVLRDDLDAFTALQTFATYTPANTVYAKTALTAKLTAMKTAQDAEVNAQNALDAARDTANAAEWDFHNALLGAKDQVIAQYGKDSDQIQALGLKKKSEHKSRARRKVTA
jgi:hypothetical protein